MGVSIRVTLAFSLFHALWSVGQGLKGGFNGNEMSS